MAQLSGSAYFDLSGSGRSVLAMRGLVGEAYGASVFSLPPDQRFYAGGRATVRGFRYQSIGPQFPDGKPTGGTAVSAGSVEFRQRILDKYGVVAFVDAGQVTAERRAVHQQLARRRRHRRALLHLDRPDPSGRGSSAEPTARMATLSSCTSASGRRSDAAQRRNVDRRRYCWRWSALPVLLLLAANTAPGRSLIERLMPLT